MFRALLVDDEQRVLDALRRQLRPLRCDWDFEFEADSVAALQRLRCQEFDVVVTDMRMPECDGARLLEEARRVQPSALRYVLSGQAEREQSLSIADSAHQYHSKPCKTTEIREALSAVSSIKQTLPNWIFSHLVHNTTLPSPPSSVAGLRDGLATPDVDLDSIGALIAQDLAMSLKSLKWVGTAFFGQPLPGARVEETPSILGASLLRSLVESGAYCRESIDEEAPRVDRLNEAFRERQGVHDAWDLIGKLALCGAERSATPQVEANAIGLALAAFWGIPLELQEAACS